MVKEAQATTYSTETGEVVELQDRPPVKRRTKRHPHPDIATKRVDVSAVNDDVQKEDEVKVEEASNLDLETESEKSLSKEKGDSDTDVIAEEGVTELES